MYMALKHQGQEKFKCEVTGPSVIKCKEKASILILQQMYGKDKKWNELQREIEK